MAALLNMWWQNRDRQNENLKNMTIIITHITLLDNLKSISITCKLCIVSRAGFYGFNHLEFPLEIKKTKK